MREKSEVSALAGAFLAGERGLDEIAARTIHMLGRRPRWLTRLIRRYLDAFTGDTRPRHADVTEFLLQEHLKLSIRNWVTGPQPMQPVAAAKTWDLPAIVSAGALEEWFQLNPGELEWFADLKGLGARPCSSRLRHYHYRVLKKASGGVRLIEAPKSRMKHMQRQILTRILNRIPAHPAVHGFVCARSIRTFAAPHVGRKLVLRMDLQDYFPSFRAARIQSFFRTAGYPETVADLLGGICTNVAPGAFRSELGEAYWLYERPHLPQGAPTSPALANLVCWRMDCRLAAYANASGANYTRYADDLAFSGDEEFARRASHFAFHVATILREEGFFVNHRKTRIMRQSVRQQLAGIVVNERMNVRRRDFDILKAILTNCARQGPGEQDRCHLEGRIGFVESVNPARGLRLRRIFERICWEPSPAAR